METLHDMAWIPAELRLLATTAAGAEGWFRKGSALWLYSSLGKAAPRTISPRKPLRSVPRAVYDPDPPAGLRFPHDPGCATSRDRG